MPRMSKGKVNTDFPFGKEAIHALVRETGKQVEDQATSDWLWHGRKVRVVDGSTITMPDTPANQAAYPRRSPRRSAADCPSRESW